MTQKTTHDKYAYQRIKSEMPMPVQAVVAALLCFLPFFLAMSVANFRQPKQADLVIGLSVLAISGGVGLKVAREISRGYK